MKCEWFSLTTKRFFLFSILSLLAFGCASQKPAAPAGSQTSSSDEYLVYALNTKKAFLGSWTVGPNFVVPADTIRVKAKVSINKDGKVGSAEIVNFSGNREVDASVQQALDRVKFVQPFGAGATDEQRTFVINFELKPKSP